MSVPVRHADEKEHRRLLAYAINRLEQDVSDYALEVSRGNIPEMDDVQKYGRCADNVDSGSFSDIWDGATAAFATKTYISPTQARIHQIASTDLNDTLGGTGANQIIVSYLADWDTAEQTVTLDMNGTTNVATPACVAINRMKCIWGATTTAGQNKGTITATADTDASVSAYVIIGAGQTQMAVFAYASTQTFYMSKKYASVNRSIAGTVDAQLLVNDNPDVQLLSFTVKDTWSAHSTGDTLADPYYDPPRPFPGPSIIKVKCEGSANNMDVSAGFYGYLETR